MKLDRPHVVIVPALASFILSRLEGSYRSRWRFRRRTVRQRMRLDGRSMRR